jgi:hypothetical protein
MEEMKSIFKNINEQNQFEKDGYMLFDLLNEDEVASLAKYYFEHVNLENDALFKVGLYMENKNMIHQMKEHIKGICLPRLKPIMGNAKFVIASYVVKFPSNEGVGAVPVHQDWSFVDNEDEYYSTTCWIPLVDVKIENGALGLIKGSNRYFKTFRPSPSRYLKNTLTDHGTDVFPYLNPVEMKAGQALFFNNATFHGSPPNCSDSIRLAIGLSFTHADARTVHYFLNPKTQGKTALKYEVDEEFFCKYNDPLLNSMFQNNQVIEDYPLIEEVNYSPPILQKEELLQLVTQSGNIFHEELNEKFNWSRQLTYGETIAPQPEIENNSKIPEEKDTRSFFQTYTPKNIILEINYRIKKLLKAF